MAKEIVDQILSELETDVNIYWVSIEKAADPENYFIGIEKGLWAVKDDYARRIKNVKKGDYVLFYSRNSGFSVCEILEGHFVDTKPVWPDDTYPNRIRIGKPLLTREEKPEDFHLCLRNIKGIPYKSPKALSMAINGAGGVFRLLKAKEVHCIFDKLGWNELSNLKTDDLTLTKETPITETTPETTKITDAQKNILTLIKASSEIADAQKKFLEVLYQEADEIISSNKIDSYRGMEVKAYWSDELGIWVVNRELGLSKFLNSFGSYLNGFGIDKPDANSNIPLVCEINIPKDGINRDVSGAFVKDLKGEIYLIHRGNIGNTSKNDFFDQYNGEPVQIQDGDLETDAVVIGGLNDPNLPVHIRDFIYEVAKIKGLTSGNLRDNLQKILKNYHNVRKQYFFGHPMIEHIKEVFPLYLSQITPHSSKYVIQGNAGKSGPGKNWTCCPSISIRNTEIAKDIQSGIFLMYIFSDDAKRVYLSLNQPVVPIKFKSSEWMEELKSNASMLREKSKIPHKFELKTLSLESKETYFKLYEVANICAKCYELDDLPSNKELVSDYLDMLNFYDSFIPNNHLKLHYNISDSLNYILDNYKDVKEGKKTSEEVELVKDLMTKILPDLLTRETENQYQILSHWDDKLHKCPYVTIISEKKSGKLNKPFYVNYMFREDMGGVYLSLRQDIKDINAEKDHINDLKAKSGKYRDLIVNTSLSSNFNDTIDLKSNKDKNAPFYEAGTIFSKLYETEHLPSNEELRLDLKEMLKLYDNLIESLKNGSKTFNEYLDRKNFLYTTETIENFLLSLKVKPFVILTGKSGTGKTKIAQLFAQYISDNDNDQYEIVPVGADWTNNKPILGFHDVIANEYQITAALKLIIRAEKNPNSPFFLILDEMNMSHVEKYFANFLSSIESKEKIPLHQSNDDIGVEKNLNIPENLFVIGTVNVDETTHMISPKVLDRANTIEFPIIPALEYMTESKKNKKPAGDYIFLENMITNIDMEEVKDQLKVVKTPNDGFLWDVLGMEMNLFQEALGKADFEFSFRVIDEILMFMYVSWIYEGQPDVWNNWKRYFDAQIMQKMLPKLHGSHILEDVLKELFKLCMEMNVYQPPRSYELGNSDLNVKYLSSALKIQEMDKLLEVERYVSFIN
jgi:MoxR-like ATPase